MQASACRGVSMWSLSVLAALSREAFQLKYASSQEEAVVANQDLLSISEVAEAMGLQSSALRYYENRV